MDTSKSTAASNIGRKPGASKYSPLVWELIAAPFYFKPDGPLHFLRSRLRILRCHRRRTGETRWMGVQRLDQDIVGLDRQGASQVCVERLHPGAVMNFSFI